ETAGVAETAAVADRATVADTVAAGAINSSHIESVDWSKLNNVPPSVLGSDTLAEMSCDSGDIPSFDGTNWVCAKNPTPFNEGGASGAIISAVRISARSTCGGTSVKPRLALYVNRVF